MKLLPYLIMESSFGQLSISRQKLESTKRLSELLEQKRKLERLIDLEKNNLIGLSYHPEVQMVLMSLSNPVV